MDKKIVFFEVEEEWEKNLLQEKFPQAVVTAEKLTSENVEKCSDAEIISVFLYSSLDREVLSQMPNLSCITTRSTGYDHIDLNYCKEKGIVVSNVPSYGASTVAEHTFALLLAISRCLIPSIENTRKGDFSLKGLTGYELSGKTIGVVGAGNIGKSVIRIANAFGMKVIVYTRDSKDISEFRNVKEVSFEELLSFSDVITFHVPLTQSTKYMLNMTNISLCKKGSILINTSRGGVIETQAIVKAVDKGIFLGVGLDVLEEECEMREERELLTTEFLKTCDLKTQLLNHVLLTRENVLVTPHNAFNSKESLEEILKITIENIEMFLQDKPQNIVN